MVTRAQGGQGTPDCLMEQETCNDEEQNLKCPEAHSPKQMNYDGDSLLEYELMKARFHIGGYLTTITSLQRRLRSMERTILELRAKECNQKHKDSQLTSYSSTTGPLKQIPTTAEHDDDVTTTNMNTGNNIISSTEESVASVTSSNSSTIQAAIFGTISAPSAPISLYKGTSTSFLTQAYFSPSGSSRVFIYDNEVGSWSELPECPNIYFSLVTVNGLVTAVGGWVDGDRKRPTNVLLSLLSASRQDEAAGSNDELAGLGAGSPDSTATLLSWSEHFPPMPTRRGYPAAVTHSHWLIVAGGDSTWLKDRFLTTVEVLNTTTLQWFTVSSLPQPLRGATAAVCVNQDSKDATLYLLGGWDRNGNTVFACSLKRLLSTAVLYDFKGTLPDLSAVAVPCSCCWKMVAGAPHSDSSCVSLGNKLFTFGGKGSSGGGSEYVHVYCEETNEWQCVGKMLVGRSHPLVAGLADGCRAVIVGGLMKGPHVTNHCEVALLIPATTDESYTLSERSELEPY